MSYVDALFDRDSDIIRVVERRDGKRHYTETMNKGEVEMKLVDYLKKGSKAVMSAISHRNLSLIHISEPTRPY